nr:MAG TPA: hypothetical protein [Caudoviricetes sp.]
MFSILSLNVNNTSQSLFPKLLINSTLSTPSINIPSTKTAGWFFRAVNNTSCSDVLTEITFLSNI